MYVPKGRKVIIADALRQVVEEEIPWPTNEEPKTEKEEDEQRISEEGAYDPRSVRSRDQFEERESSRKAYNFPT